jgi:hypothetical protein
VRSSIVVCCASFATASVFVSFVAQAESPVATENSRAVSRERDDWLPRLDPTTGEAPDVAIDGDPRGIEGYPSAWSVANGDALGLKVSTRAAAFRTRIYRLGWYANSSDGPVGSRLVYEVASTAGVDQPLPAEEPRTGLAEARWRDVVTLTIPRDWVSGHYVVRFTTLTPAGSKEGFTYFVVRDDARAQKAPLLYVDTLATAHAYNPWPKVLRDAADPSSQVRGKSLYAYNSAGIDVQASGAKQAVAVSFDRPHGENWGLGIWRDWTVPMVQWLEMKGYDVAYATSLDLHVGGVLAGRKAWMDAGHDEYWSREMWDNLEAARDRGVSLAWLSGNDLTWQTRYEPGAGGPFSTMVSYKTAAYPDEGRCGSCYPWGGDPEFQAALAAKQRGDLPAQRAHLRNVTYSFAGLKDWDPDAPSLLFPGRRGAPAQNAESLTRLGIGLEGLMNGPKLPECAADAPLGHVCRGIPWVVERADHWIYTGEGVPDGVATGLREADRIPQIVGYEMDNVRALQSFHARPPGQIVLAHADTVFTPADRSAVDFAGSFNAQYYQAASGAHVFAAGTINWPWALERPGAGAWGGIPIGEELRVAGSGVRADVAVSAITTNVLNAMIHGRAAAPATATTPEAPADNGSCGRGGASRALALLALGAFAARHLRLASRRHK